MGRKKNKGGFIEAQCGPLVTGRGSVAALQRFSSFPCAVLSFCSHTVWALTVESAADFEMVAADYSCIQTLQSPVWRGRWFTVLASLISQWEKTFAACVLVLIFSIQMLTLWF